MLLDKVKKYNAGCPFQFVHKREKITLKKMVLNIERIVWSTPRYLLSAKCHVDKISCNDVSVVKHLPAKEPDIFLTC